MRCKSIEAVIDVIAEERGSTGGDSAGVKTPMDLR